MPRTLFLAIYISIVLTLIFLLTISINLVNIKNKRDLWEYAINLSNMYLCIAESQPTYGLILSTYIIL